MATRTGTGKLLATLAPGEFLQYTLTVRGSRANMVWTDDQENQVLSSNDFPMLNQLKWQLQTTAQNESVVISVPESATYTRTVPIGTLMSYGLSMTFLTATGYTLNVQRSNAGGPIETISSFDYTMGNPDDEVLEGLGVQV
jgi:hypothetical protein